MDADFDGLGAVYDDSGPVAVLCWFGACQKRSIGSDAMLRADGADVGPVVVVGYTLAFGSAGVEQGPWIGDLGNLFLARSAWTA